MMVAALLTALALFSHNPQDPAPFFSSTTGENARATNWIGGFGAMWSRVLLTAFGFTSWLLPVGLAIWGARRFSGGRFANPGTKAVGLLLTALSLPALLALLLGTRQVAGEPIEAGGLLGQGIAAFTRSRFNTAGAAILLSAVFLLAIPLSTQISLADAVLVVRVKMIALFGKFSLGFSRRRERRIKDRLKRAVVLKHIEKSRQEERVPDFPAPPPAAPDRGDVPEVRLPPYGSPGGPFLPLPLPYQRPWVN